MFVLMPGSCPRMGFWGTLVPSESKKHFIFKHGFVAYQIDGELSRNQYKYNFYPKVNQVTLARGQKVE